MTEGRDLTWEPRVSGHLLRRDGAFIVKSFGERLWAFGREQAVLVHLAAVAPGLPVPRVEPSSRFGELRLTEMPGINGEDAIDRGLAQPLLESMGAFLRRLHAIDVSILHPLLPGRGGVLTHGDFAPYNVLADASTGVVCGVVDWEEARCDVPALDLGWCEAQFLARHRHERSALHALRSGYESPPSVMAREHAVAERFAQLTADARARAAAPAPCSVMWACPFAAATEASAFVAALSRHLASPEGIDWGGLPAEVLVWASSDNATVYLTPAALAATEAHFGRPPAAYACPLNEITPNAQLLYAAISAPAWGVDAATGRLTRT